MTSATLFPSANSSTSATLFPSADQSSVTICQSYDELNNQIDNNPDVVIDFYADWCQPCIKGGPLFEERSRDSSYKNIKFIKVNIDNIRDYLDDFEITSIPALTRYRNGKMCKKITGLNKETLDDILS